MVQQVREAWGFLGAVFRKDGPWAALVFVLVAFLLWQNWEQQRRVAATLERTATALVTVTERMDHLHGDVEAVMTEVRDLRRYSPVSRGASHDLRSERAKPKDEEER